MKRQIRLSHINLFAGLFFSVLEKYAGYSEKKYKSISKNKLVKSLEHKRDTRFRHSIQVREDKNKQLQIEKQFIFKYRNMKYYQFINEINMLSLLKKYGQNVPVSFPTLLRSQIRNHILSFSMEYVEGKELKEKLSQEDLTSIIKNILFSYEEITKRLPKQTLNNLPKRTIKGNALSFPIYMLAATLKDTKNVKLYLSLACRYYFYIAEQLISKNGIHYVLSHRDLHHNNIILKGKKIFIIDNEITCLAEKNTDLAIIARYYYSSLKSTGVTKVMNLFSQDTIEARRFIRLSIFYTIQAIAFESKDNAYFKISQSYLRFLYSLSSKKKYKSILFEELGNAFNKAIKISL